VSILFEIETWDEAVYESMTTGEVTVEFIDVIQDWREVSVDTISKPPPPAASVS
jgi:hypothetical protein